MIRVFMIHALLPKFYIWLRDLVSSAELRLSSVDSFVNRAAKEFVLRFKAIAKRPLWKIAPEEPASPDARWNGVALKHTALLMLNGKA